MNSDYCSPNNSNNSISCFDDKSLINIAHKYNKYYDEKIDIPEILDEESKQILWQKILDKVNSKTQCNYEYCWLKQDFIKNNLDIELLNNFRPKMPSDWNINKTKWLSTLDIQAVLKQYEKQYSDFKFIGAVPIDFDYEIFSGFCVTNELCNINLANLYKNGIRKLGVVFNFDPHNKPGSHWVAMYSDFNNGGIYYFDSYGKEPVDEIDRLMEKIRIQGNNLIYNKSINFKNMNNFNSIYADIINADRNKITLNKAALLYTPTITDNSNKIFNLNSVNNMEYNINTNVKNIKNAKKIIQKGFRKYYSSKRYQYKFSECGMYSIFFIHTMLSGKNYKQALMNMKSDDEINNLRDKYYISDN